MIPFYRIRTTLTRLQSEATLGAWFEAFQRTRSELDLDTLEHSWVFRRKSRKRSLGQEQVLGFVRVQLLRNGSPGLVIEISARLGAWSLVVVGFLTACIILAGSWPLSALATFLLLGFAVSAYSSQVALANAVYRVAGDADAGDVTPYAGWVYRGR